MLWSEVSYLLEADFHSADGSGGPVRPVPLDTHMDPPGDFDDAHTPLQAFAKSIYLAFALFVQTGGHTPVSPVGRIFQVTETSLLICYMLSVVWAQIGWGFTMLVVLSSYTASMATFLTVSATPVNTINSVEDLVRKVSGLRCNPLSVQSTQRAIHSLQTADADPTPAS